MAGRNVFLCRLHALSDFANSLVEPGIVEGLEQIVRGIEFKGFDRVMVVCCREHHGRLTL